MELTLDKVDYALEVNVANATVIDSRPQASARLIEYAPGWKIALPTHTTYGLIENPEFVVVPGAVDFAYGMITWQNARLPLLNIEILLHADMSILQADIPRYALIVAYQSRAKGPVEFGAIGLNILPQTIVVDDASQCSIPDECKVLQLLALSCFQHEGQAIAILDTAKIFSPHHRFEH